jgi:hypothetical protein
MKRFRALRPLALAVCILLAGCGPTPEPSLSSTNRSERLQVVRTAQKKWGVSKQVTRAPDKEAIVGRWNHPWADAAYFRFNADGTFKLEGWLGWTEGTYRVLSNNTIEFNYAGIFGRNVSEIKYRLNGDTLEVKESFLSGWLKYKRAS